MEVHLRHYKGVDNKPKPTTFLFRENPRPILCPVSHILARAICDDAILVDGYTHAKPFFDTDLGGERMKAMKVHWKQEWLKRPVFRRSVWTGNRWIKSKTKLMIYSTFNFYLGRIGRDIGMEEQVTSYAFRRGLANGINGLAPDSVRDQVMRHDPLTGVFCGSYISGNVRFNVQDAYLEGEISEDGLTRAFTHMSIRCNPGAPEEVPQEMMDQFLAADPDIVDLERRCKESHTRIKWEYKFIKRAPKEIRDEHESLGKQLKNAKKHLGDEMNTAIRRDYFFRIHNEMMKRQLMRKQYPTVAEEDEEDEEDEEPMVEHQLEERTRVQQVLCDLSKDLSPQDLVARKILAIDLMIALMRRQEFQTRKPRRAPASKAPVWTDSPPLCLDTSSESDKFPLVCGKEQCIFCIGEKQYSDEYRTRLFSRVSHMMDHVENVHLIYYDANKAIICPHPICTSEGLVLECTSVFKNHVQTIHGIKLREPRFVELR